MKHLLLVEDDPNLGTVMKEYLGLKGYKVTLARDGLEGLEEWKTGNHDIAILDVMMPRMDGFTLGREIRKMDQNTPIIFLTAKTMIEDKVEAFGLGGDDYLCKPFSMEELLLRIKALFKRSTSQPQSDTPALTRFDIGDFSFDAPTRKLSRGAETKRLTSREGELLGLLCKKMNDVLSREEALKEIWGDDSYFNARSMDVFITRLRKYLKPDPKVSIMNVHGKGYKLLVTG